MGSIFSASPALYYPTFTSDDLTKLANLQPVAGSLFNTPSVEANQLTRKDIHFLWNQQNGNYAQIGAMPLAQQQQIEAQAQANSHQDPGDLIDQQQLDTLRQSSYYQQFKSIWKGITSKQAAQEALSLNPNTSKTVKEAFYLLYQRKEGEFQNSQMNFKNALAQLQQPDEDAQKLHDDVEKQSQDIARSEAGLDPSDGGDGSDSSGG